MADTDDKINGVNANGDGDEVKSYADILPPRSPSDEDDAKKQSVDKKSFAGELVVFSLKAVAVALSLVILILSIITVAAPLSAMRVFNNMGMYERALNSGDRYIFSRLKSAGADKENAFGEYRALMTDAELSDGDMLEALDVCIGLSDKLMRKYADDDKKSSAYFADELDKYIRILFSLQNETDIMREKTKKRLEAFAPAYRPLVYDYKHSLMTLDYEARVRSADGDKIATMFYDSNGATPSDRDESKFTMPATTQSHNLYSVVLNSDTAWNTVMNYIDWFVDYVDQLGTYLDIKERALGLTKPISEVEANRDYLNALNGDEFSLLITPGGGYTRLYNELMGNSGVMDMSARANGLMFKFGQLAYEFDTRGDSEIALHRLYWLRIINSTAERLWNMQMLLFRSRDMFGQNSTVVSDEYYTDAFKYARCVIVGYDDQSAPVYRDLSTLYSEEAADWLRDFS